MTIMSVIFGNYKDILKVKDMTIQKSEVRRSAVNCRPATSN